MNKLVIFAVAAAVVAGAAYWWFQSSTFAISDSQPLGRFDVVDQWLATRGFERDTVEVDEEALEKYGAELRGATLYVYEHEHPDRMDGRNSIVAIALDAAGEIAAVRTTFRSGAEEMRQQLSPSHGETFTNRMWYESTGAKAVFQDRMVGSGRFARMQRVARFERGDITGEWTKHYMTNSDARTIWDTATFHRAQ